MKMKNILALILALVMILACVPMLSLAAGAGEAAQPGEGDVSIPIIPGAPLPDDEDDLVPGDMDGNEVKDTEDAVYLLLNVLFGDGQYPIVDGAETDINGDGKTDTEDAVYLLLNVLFGDGQYPIG